MISLWVLPMLAPAVILLSGCDDDAPSPEPPSNEDSSILIPTCSPTPTSSQCQPAKTAPTTPAIETTSTTPALEVTTPAPTTVAPTQAIACKSWCKVDQCSWKPCLDCTICHAPDSPEATQSATPHTHYPTSKAYGPHYFSNDDTVPSWYGLQCKAWCLNGWHSGKCNWKSCSGCKKPDGAAACEIPKYVSGKKNVLLLLTDDLNVDLETYQYGHPQAYTPNIKKLAESGTRFDHAYAVHPICMPSRAAFLTGIYGVNSFNMFKEKYFENPRLSKSRTFVEMFKLNGYYTVGTGKIGHYEKNGMFELWGNNPNYGPLWRTNGSLSAHPKVKDPLASYGYIDGSFGRLSEAKDYITDTDGTNISKSGWSNAHGGVPSTMKYVNDDDRDPTPDESNANFAIEQLETNTFMKHASWFMAVGFVRPHTPLHAPDKYFDHFPIDDIVLGEAYGIKAGDQDDINFISDRGKEMYDMLSEGYGLEHGLKLYTQAYLACVYAVDDQIGRVLTALEANSFSDSTIVVMTSDHGWHNGQKQILWKNTPWEQSARIPLIIKDPDYPPNQVEFPVSMIDIYPTLLDLAKLEIKDTLIEDGGLVPDGYSLKPFLENASFDDFERKGAISIIAAHEWEYTNDRSASKWNPKLFTMTVRLKDYRYIMVKDGTEELYNNANDPYEWTNLLFTSDLKTDENLKTKKDAIAVLNSEFMSSFGNLDAENDPKSCGEALWAKC